jgi:hypothetical protein
VSWDLGSMVWQPPVGPGTHKTHLTHAVVLGLESRVGVYKHAQIHKTHNKTTRTFDRTNLYDGYASHGCVARLDRPSSNTEHLHAPPAPWLARGQQVRRGPPSCCSTCTAAQASTNVMQRGAEAVQDMPMSAAWCERLPLPKRHSRPRVLSPPSASPPPPPKKNKQTCTVPPTSQLRRRRHSPNEQNTRHSTRERVAEQTSIEKEVLLNGDARAHPLQ